MYGYERVWLGLYSLAWDIEQLSFPKSNIDLIVIAKDLVVSYKP